MNKINDYYSLANILDYFIDIFAIDVGFKKVVEVAIESSKHLNELLISS